MGSCCSRGKCSKGCWTPPKLQETKGSQEVKHAHNSIIPDNRASGIAECQSCRFTLISDQTDNFRSPPTPVQTIDVGIDDNRMMLETKVLSVTTPPSKEKNPGGATLEETINNIPLPLYSYPQQVVVVDDSSGYEKPEMGDHQQLPPVELNDDSYEKIYTT